MEKKGILPPTLKMILKTYYPLPVSQPPLPPQDKKTPSYPPPLPCTEPDSLGDDQTKSESPGAPTDGREQDQLEVSLVEQPEKI